MNEEILDPVRELVSVLLGYEYGTYYFKIVLLVVVLVWAIIARFFTRIQKSPRGLIAALLALAFPVCLGLLAYGLATTQVAPQFEIDWVQMYFAHGVGALVAFLTMMTVSRRILELDGFGTILVFTFATAAAVCAYGITVVSLQTLSQGGQQIQQREERSKNAIDSVL